MYSKVCCGFIVVIIMVPWRQMFFCQDICPELTCAWSPASSYHSHNCVRRRPVKTPLRLTNSELANDSYTAVPGVSSLLQPLSMQKIIPKTRIS